MPSNNISITDFFLARQIVRTTYDAAANVHTPWQNAKLQISNTDVAANNPVWTLEPDAAGAAPVTGTGSGNVGATGNLFALDTTGYESIAIHVTNSGNGSTIEFKGSDDHSNWFQVLGHVEANVAGGGPPTTRTAATTGGLVFPVKYRYFLANVSAYGGSVNVVASYALRKSPVTLSSNFINNSNTNPIPVVLTQANAIGSNTNPAPVTLSVANAIATNTNPVPTLRLVANATSTEATHNNQDGTANLVTVTAANTASANSSDQVNYNWRGVKVFLNVTAVVGSTCNTQIVIENKDPVSATYYTVLTSAINPNTAGSYCYTVYPGVHETNNVAVSDVISRTWRVRAVTAGTGTTTFGVSATMLL